MPTALLLLSWGSDETFRPKFIPAWKFICVSYVIDAVSMWSQDFYICIHLFAQMIVVPSVVK